MYALIRQNKIGNDTLITIINNEDKVREELSKEEDDLKIITSNMSYDPNFQLEFIKMGEVERFYYISVCEVTPYMEYILCYTENEDKPIYLNYNSLKKGRSC